MSYLYIVEIQVIVTRPQTPQARQVLQVARTPRPLPTALILKNHPHLHPKKENKNPKRRIINLRSHRIVIPKIYILHCFDPTLAFCILRCITRNALNVTIISGK